MTGWERSPTAGTPRTATAQWKRARRQILDRDGGLCQLRLLGCTTTATQVDHIQGHAQGGSDDHANLRAVCQTCHRQVTSKQGTEARRRRPTEKRSAERHPGLANDD